MHINRRLLAVISICCLIILGLTLAFINYTQDDVFITYTYSRNIAQGNGFVFNLGEYIQGTTTPLWSLMMAGVYLLTPNLLVLGNLLGGLFFIVLLICVLMLINPFIHFYAQAVLAFLIVSSPIFYISFGMETLLYCFLFIFSLMLWSKDKRVWALVLAGLLTWTRADGVVLGGTFALIILYEWLYRRQLSFIQSVRYGMIYLLTIAPWFIFAYLYFGSFTPNTLSAKATIFTGINFLEKGWELRDSLYNNNILHWLALLFIPVGIWGGLKIPKLRPLALWTIFYLIGYTVLNVSYFWYYTPLVLALLILAVLGAYHFITILPKTIPAPLIQAVVLIMVLISTVFGIARAYENRIPPTRMTTYRLVGEWIQQHTPQDSTVAVADLGIVGYYAQRRTIDSFGLVMRDMYHYTPSYMAIKYKPDFLVATQFFIFGRFINEPWFHYHFTPLVAISTEQDTEFSPMVLYQRRLPLITPPMTYIGVPIPLTCQVQLPKNAILPGETFARLYRDDQLIRQDAHLFLWHQYPAPASLGDEVLIEQLAFQTTNLTEGVYRWELDCDQRTTGTIQLEPLANAPDYIRLEGAVWDDMAQLNGIWMPNGMTTWSGGSIFVILDWQALSSDITDNYVLNLELVDSQGIIRNGANISPYYPTSTWEQNDVMAGEWYVHIPPDLPSGEYRLQLGWFHPETNERLAVGDGTTYILPITILNQFPGGSGRP